MNKCHYMRKQDLCTKSENFSKEMDLCTKSEKNTIRTFVLNQKMLNSRVKQQKEKFVAKMGKVGTRNCRKTFGNLKIELFVF